MKINEFDFGNLVKTRECKEFVSEWLMHRYYDDGELEWVKHSLERTAQAVGILTQKLLELDKLSEDDLLDITQCYHDIEIVKDELG